MADWSWIGPLASGILQGVNSGRANDAASGDYLAAYDQMLRNLQDRFGDYDRLGKAGYQDITAQQVGPSALEGIPEDMQARLAQQQAMAALGGLSDSGGLNLADMNALNQIQGNLNRNNMARQKGLANEFAARGQLGSGAQLAMALQGQQDAAQNANQRGESIAAQAQQRALDAILKKGEMARNMGSDDYRRRAAAAQARDAIEARNAAARTDASKYNNSLRGQAFEDELAKARGKTALTDSMNQSVFGKGQTQANQKLANANLANAGIRAGGSAVSELFKDDSSTQGNAAVSQSADDAESEEVEGGDD